MYLETVTFAKNTSKFTYKYVCFNNKKYKIVNLGLESFTRFTDSYTSTEILYFWSAET